MAASCLVGAGCFYLLCAWPALRRLAELNRQVQDRRTGLATAEPQLLEAASLTRQVQQLRARLETPEYRLLSADTESRAAELARLSRQARLQRVTVQPGIPTHREQVWQLPVLLNFEGDFLNVFAFLRDAEHMPGVTRITFLHIHATNPYTGQVEVQSSVDAYWAQE